MSYDKYSSILLVSMSLCNVILSGCQTETADVSKQADQEYDCSASKTLAAAKANNKPWSMSEVSASGDLSIDFSCKSGPFVGGFQQCEIQLYHLKKPLFADAISIDGGMKAHGHGLPTVPSLSPTAKAGHYQLEGLKYSMPGAWTVGFRVNIGGKTDQVIFEFTI